MGNGPGQLCGHRDQKGHTIFTKGGVGTALHHQHSQQLTVVDDGHAKEGMKAFLAGLGEIFEARVGGGIGQIERLFALADQADQALRGVQPHGADGLGIQAIAGHEDVFTPLLVLEVDRADFHPHRPLDAGDDDLQGLIQVLGIGDFLNDAPQRIQHPLSLC